MDGGPCDLSYHIAAELKPGCTWLARDATQRPLVLKRLPADCLRKDQLHPAIRDRLARFRELPLMPFATLIGVERVDDNVFAVSEYIEGTHLADVAPADRPRLLKSLRDTIAALHSLGLVHGALHEGNIIIDPLGRVRVIDPSPLLHDDPADDLAALDKLDPPVKIAAASVVDEDEPIRRRTFTAAAVVAAIGVISVVVAAVVLWRSA